MANYTEKEIQVIKQRAYDKGRLEGAFLTLLIVGIALIYYLYNMS